MMKRQGAGHQPEGLTESSRGAEPAIPPAKRPVWIHPGLSAKALAAAEGVAAPPTSSISSVPVSSCAALPCDSAREFGPILAVCHPEKKFEKVIHKDSQCPTPPCKLVALTIKN